MHVFVTGGTGQTGPTIVAELIGSGHTVTGLARSDAAAARLQALGATPLRGSVDDVDTLQCPKKREHSIVALDRRSAGASRGGARVGGVFEEAAGDGVVGDQAVGVAAVEDGLDGVEFGGSAGDGDDVGDGL